jgi:hypothetical protein
MKPARKLYLGRGNNLQQQYELYVVAASEKMTSETALEYSEFLGFCALSVTLNSEY